METKRIGIFIRVSTEMQVQDESPEHHEQRARYYVNAKNWQVMEVYKLDAVSGKSVMQHPETKRMIADVKSGHINGLVFSKLARLARNTIELLEFSNIFRASGADLISLAESIDTSTPAGRLFYTVIAAMAEWEREEISSRVAASVPIRAKMGKPLGGQASFGYQWVDKELVINEQEAPVRKLMYELFLKYQRKFSTAKALNDAGYRTRNGSKFTATSLSRLLRDSSAKGERRANYTKSLGDGKAWVIKPESEWVVMPCPPVVSPELWQQVNSLLDIQEKKKSPGPKAVYLLSGFVKCTCGKPMYVYHTSKVYACAKCRHRIAVADLDEIFQVYLKEYLESIEVSSYITETESEIEQKQALLESTRKERARLQRNIDAWIDMRSEQELSKEQFAEKYRPAEERLNQLDKQLPMLEAEIDVYTIQLLSSDTIMQDVHNLYSQWGVMTFEQKRSIVETVVSSITIGKEDIDITLAYIPQTPLNAKKGSHNVMDSYWR
ncbi:recombinase family protein [Mucilaginibacter sp. ZT4R22]|uniref:Recombinase family protein n=1 Tax=Mucilaginibacter pankratovii TaxID=2772110 RepID=A0ABR7WMF1_9SPHI|nr:recombinase family protein [Mucilaginibacter pankratovii]MBD1363470.1 recombinase family protein [Mucilaginibacter pankratovii]